MTGGDNSVPANNLSWYIWAYFSSIDKKFLSPSIGSKSKSQYY